MHLAVALIHAAHNCENKAARVNDRYVPALSELRVAVVGLMGGDKIDQTNNISHGKNKLSREKYHENRFMEERYGALSTLEIYELRMIFDNYLFLRSSLPNCWREEFFSFLLKIKRVVLTNSWRCSKGTVCMVCGGLEEVLLHLIYRIIGTLTPSFYMINILRLKTHITLKLVSSKQLIAMLKLKVCCFNFKVICVLKNEGRTVLKLAHSTSSNLIGERGCLSNSSELLF